MQGVEMNILVAYKGGTDLDKIVLELAKKHAQAFKATLYIATSMESASSREIDQLDDIESHLKYLKETIDQEGIPCETHLLIRGIAPGEDIVEFANDHKIDEIFIGIKKKSKVGKLIFGSNAQYIILEAPCPVVSVK
jgi:nucleotide-binding universal stress UspA family protein